MPSKKIITPLEPGKYYHIYNRGNDRILIFYSDWQYSYLLRLLKEYLLPYAKLLAYALLPNHYHFLIQVNDPVNKSVSDQIRLALIRYVTKLNSLENRTGSLFTKPFRRISIDTEDYLRALLFYIHFNPEKHRMTDDFKNYPYSSYKFWTPRNQLLIDEQGINQFFSNRQEYLSFHSSLHEDKIVKNLIFED